MTSPPVVPRRQSILSQDPHHSRSLRSHRRHVAARLGSLEAQPNESGERLIWIERVWANKLSAMRGPGDSYSDVILRLANLEAG